jgi:hypothetical protein
MIRARLIKAVLTDTELLALTVNRRSIRMPACQPIWRLRR